MADDANPNSIELAKDIIVAWLGNTNTRVSVDEIPGCLKTIYAAVSSLGTLSSRDDTTSPEQVIAAVTARKSLASPDYIVSMIDGKPYKTLRRHLSTHGLTPEQYRERFGLKSDYPMVAPSYSIARREMAKRIGLGRKPAQKLPPKAAASPQARKRKTVEPAV